MKNETTKKAWTYALSFMAMAIMVTAPDMAHAAAVGGAVIGDILCSVVDWFTGPVGQGIATLAIIVIGVGALMGKVSWGMAIIVGIGVAVIFGASSLVTDLAAGSSNAAGSGC